MGRARPLPRLSPGLWVRRDVAAWPGGGPAPHAPAASPPCGIAPTSKRGPTCSTRFYAAVTGAADMRVPALTEFASDGGGGRAGDGDITWSR